MKTPNEPRRVLWKGQSLAVAFARYGNGRLAVLLIDRDGEEVKRATVNLPEAALAPGEVCIKDYSENTGMLATLVAAGIVADTGRRLESGWVQIPVGRLLIDPPA